MARLIRARERDCPLRGAKWPVLGSVAAAVALVGSSLALQEAGVLNMSEHGIGNDAPSPPPQVRSLIATAPATPPAPAPTRPGVVAEVVRVVDGDTARVRTASSGEELTLRFIGLDTPETVHPSQPVGCYGPEASAEAKRLMPPGAAVRLVYDPTQGLTDKYGRTLAYLHLPGGMDFAEHMISTGHGTEYTYRKTYNRADTYRDAEDAAAAAGRGLWGACER